MEIKNTESLQEDFIWRGSAGLMTKLLGAAAGSQKFYVNVDFVSPKAYSTKYHSHSRQEEFFLILSGTGSLRINDVEQSVKKGDFIAKPAGQDIAHTFYNDSDAALVILDIGTNEKEDTCYYPDEDMYLQKSNGNRRVFRGADLDSSWTSEPNQDTVSADNMGLPDDIELNPELADLKGIVTESGCLKPGKTVQGEKDDI